MEGFCRLKHRVPVAIGHADIFSLASVSCDIERLRRLKVAK
ncbi:hypothetical protein SAMN05421753_10678 [Planctomicrobium piriforme]|uniref:Uncharacterized protein n=1 Tax=Planctomicrobium piriforme TaxID=1576369 RepID=A0A1I3FYE5_9PLAN|nr:hypothetical protein SAMN05421753_10678 [Planctomicrobium piriforme]